MTNPAPRVRPPVDLPDGLALENGIAAPRAVTPEDRLRPGRRNPLRLRLERALVHVLLHALEGFPLRLRPEVVVRERRVAAVAAAIATFGVRT